MDDSLIFSTKEQHWENLEDLFEVLIQYGLKISPHKCQLFRDKLIYIGLEFLIKDGTAHYTAMRDKCDTIWIIKPPKFEDIKKLLVKPPVLRMVSSTGFFRLESDTSQMATGGTLYQWQDNQWVLVGYHSKRLPDPVRNYGVTELELTGLLANIHSFEQKLKNCVVYVMSTGWLVTFLTLLGDVAKR